MKEPLYKKKAIISWCIFDWANSAFPTVIITFVFASYYSENIAKTSETGMAEWGWMLSLSSFCVAFLGPAFGALADHTGNKKTWLLIFTLLCIVTCISLWKIRPNEDFVFLALCLVGFGNFSFEMGMIFYNALLINISPTKDLGRLSGLGWALGYFGGLSCLGLILIGFIENNSSLLNLDHDTAEHIRITGPIVGLWMTCFSVPLFLWVPDNIAPNKVIISYKRGLKGLKLIFNNIKRSHSIFEFLIARMIYNDGLNTLFALGGIYAAGTFGFNFSELIIFGILINISAGLGSGIYAWVDKWIETNQTIIICLVSLIALTSLLLIVESKKSFWLIGVTLGLFIGPIQPASRAIMAKLTRKKQVTSMFGFYAMSGKVTAFLGPALLSTMTTLFDSQRIGMSSILIFFIIGLLLFLKFDRNFKRVY